MIFEVYELNFFLIDISLVLNDFVATHIKKNIFLVKEKNVRGRWCFLAKNMIFLICAASNLSWN